MVVYSNWFLTVVSGMNDQPIQCSVTFYCAINAIIL